MMPNLPRDRRAMLAATSLGARGRPARPTSASRACSTASARSSPRSSLPATATGMPASASICADKLAEIVPQLPTAAAVMIVDYLGDAGAIASGLPRATTFARRHRSRYAAQKLRFDAAAVQPSALHPLLLGHDRRAEVHRAWRWRHAAAASEGAQAALRRPAGRPRLLLHDLRLDDVELARIGASPAARP